MSLIVWIHRILFYYSFTYMILGFLLLDYYRNLNSLIIFMVSLVLCGLTTLYLLRFLNDYWRKRNSVIEKRTKEET